ncbi:MAG: ornithine cyclodeaminase family protein, partial [Bacteroidota bacterium]
MSTSNNKTLILSAADIESIFVDIGMNEMMDELIHNMKEAFQQFDPRQKIIPVRSGFNYKKPAQGLIEWMPLHDRGEKVVVKMVGYHPNNPDQHQLPTIVSTISSYDTNTGHLTSLVDGIFLTALRTGCASAIASEVLAHPESSVLGLIGCGAQSVTQLHALSRVFDLKKVIFYDVDESVSDSFIERVLILDLPVQYEKRSIKELVQTADIICTATSVDIGEGPLFKNVDTKSYLHINAVGSDFPGKIELPVDLLKKSFVCPDFVEQAMKEGECQQLLRDDIGADIFECIRAPKKYNQLKEQRTVFDSTGLALEDQVVVDLFLKYATQLGLGQWIEIENMSLDARNPYHFVKKEREINVLELDKIEHTLIGKR